MAADGLGLVYNKQEGSGMAQIFGPSGVVDDLRKATLTQAAADEAARKEAAKTITPKAPKEQKLGTFEQPWAIDNAYISEALKIYTQDGTKKIAAKIDLNTDEEYQNGANLLASTIEGSNQQKILFNQQRTAVINDPKKFDVEATVAAMEEWALIPLMQRLSTPMPDPIYKKEEEKPVTYDLFKETSTMQLPYISSKTYNPDTSGTDITQVKTADLREQSKMWIDSRGDVYKWGLQPQTDGKPLWTNRDEAADYIYRLKKSQAKYTSDEIIAQASDRNAFGSGNSKEEVILAKEDWKKKFVNGDLEAAAYVTGTTKNGVTTNDGYVLDGVRAQTFSLDNPIDMGKALDALGMVRPPNMPLDVLKTKAPAEYQKLVDGIKSMYKNNYGGNTLTIYKYNAVGTPITQEDAVGVKYRTPDIIEKTYIANTMTDEELDDFFTTKVQKSKRVFGYDIGVSESGNIKVTDKKKPEDNTGTAKNVGSTAPKTAPVALSPSGKKIIPGVRIK
jgi:hypothetical protein